jgi:hypothetical protein
VAEWAFAAVSFAAGFIYLINNELLTSKQWLKSFERPDSL